MINHYIALIHKEAGSDYGVSFPDFPGVVTAGATLDEARAMAEEALGLHIDGMLEDGEEVPTPSGLDKISADPSCRDALIMLVPAEARTRRAVRINVSLPEDVLAKIDRYAASHGLTRSRFLVEAARRAIASGALYGE